MSYPKKILIREEGIREGFQFIKRVVSTKDKLKLIGSLIKTGIQSMEVTSFVRPDLVPQHADANELSKELKVSKTSPRYRALYLNKKGFELAKKHQSLTLEGMIHISPSDSFLKKNSNSSLDKVLSEISNWNTLFKNNDVKFERVMISCAFGDYDNGKFGPKENISIIKKAITIFKDSNIELPEFTLADTTGFSDYKSAKEIISGIKESVPEINLGLHLHDTRGQALTAALAGLELGIDKFDTSLAGLGGCPFTAGASGNLCTEDFAYMCKCLGIETGLNLEAYIESAKLAESICQTKLPGKLKDAKLI